jgi:hypothetical protein
LLLTSRRTITAAVASAPTIPGLGASVGCSPPPPGTASSFDASHVKRPSFAATTPTRSRPVTRTKARHD